VDASCIYQVVAAICVEGLEVRDVLKEVRIKLPCLKGFVRCYVVRKLTDFKGNALSCKVINNKVEKCGMRLGGRTNSQDI
jgi:hypothetical protein